MQVQTETEAWAFLFSIHHVHPGITVISLSAIKLIMLTYMDTIQMNKLNIVCIALTLSACSNTPVPTSQAKEVSGSKLLTTEFSQKNEASGTVIVKRDSGKMGSLCTLRIFVDGKPLANLESEEKVTAYLNPGRHIISADPRGACTGGMSEQIADLASSETQIFRASFGSSGDFILSPTAF